jgi:hypothetical protein
MSSTTADALGLSRAILCNGRSIFLLLFFQKINKFFITDGLIKRLEDLERNELLYKGLIEHSKRLLKAIMELSVTHKGLFIIYFLFIKVLD